MVTNALQCRMFSKTEKVHRGKTNWPRMAGSVNVTNECGNFSKTKNGKLVDPVWPDCNSANYLCGNFSNFHCRKRMIKAFLGIKWIKTKIDMFPQIQVGPGSVDCSGSIIDQTLGVFASKSSNLLWHRAQLLHKPACLKIQIQIQSRVTLSDIHRPQLSLKCNYSRTKKDCKMQNCVSIFVAFLPCVNMWI